MTREPSARLRAFACLARQLAAHRREQPGATITGPHMLHTAEDGALALDALALDTLAVDATRLGDPSDSAALPYTAPEVLLQPGSAAREPAAVYTLAAILHEDLTGVPPFPGRNATEIVDRVLAGTAPRVPRATQLPPAVHRYLVDSLGLDPESRPASLEQFATGLEALAAGDHVRATPEHRRVLGPRRSLRAAALVVIGLAAIVAFAGTALHRARLRAELLGQLQEVAAARPFPVHGEDAPWVAHARDRLAAIDLAGLPPDPVVSLALGWARLRAGDLGGARAAFEHVITHDPSGVAGWVSLGIARLEAGDDCGAHDLQLGLARSPRCTRGWQLRGAGCLYLHRFAAAAAAFRRVTEAEPDTFSPWLHRALAEHLAGQPAAAAEALAVAGRLRPGDLWVIWLRAEHALATGDPEGACRLLDRSKARLVGEPPLALRCGSLLCRAGRSGEGQEWLVSAFRDASPEQRLLRLRPLGRLELPGRSRLFFGPEPLDVIYVPPPEDPFAPTPGNR